MAEQMDRESELPAKINASSASEDGATGVNDENDPEKRLLAEKQQGVNSNPQQ